MLIKGLDVGYSHTKDNNGRIFRSAYSTNDTSVVGSKKLTIDGKNYYIGSGKMTSEVDKTNTELNKVCTIYNIIMSDAKDLCVVAGLPIGQYEEQKVRLKESILGYNKCVVSYDNRPCSFKIHDVIVSPQGVSSLYTLKELLGEYIVIDIGGLTIDPCLVEFTATSSQILKSDTWYKGMRTLYSSIIEIVNNRYGLKLDNSYAEKILLMGLKVRGVQQDLSFLKPLLQDYIDILVEEIKLKYPTETTPMYLVGGGTDLLYNAFRKRFQDVNKIVNPQFANAIGYYNIGYFKFAERSVACGR